MKKTDAQRQAEWERKYDSLEFIGWTHESPSVASGQSPCVCAHVTPDTGLPTGTGRKADACWIVPLTSKEHDEIHQHGERTFEAKYNLNLADEARKHWANRK